MSNLDLRFRILKSIKEKSKLPNDYQKLNYIQNDGTQGLIQYIDTEVLSGSDNIFEVKAQLINIDFTSQSVWGGRSGTSGDISSNQLSFVKSSAIWQFVYGAVSGTNEKWDYDLHTFFADKNNLYIDNVLIYALQEKQNFPTPRNIYLFATNTNGTAGFGGGSLKMYYFKIWNNETLVRDFVPCIERSSGKVGMFDLVEQKFFGNKGQGQFLGG